jgi:hypothetical protein
VISAPRVVVVLALTLSTIPLLARGSRVAVGPEFTVNRDSSPYSDEESLFHGPDAAGDAAGNFVVVWQDTYPESSPYIPSIQARRFDRSGAPRGHDFTVSDLTTYSRRDAPAVAARPAGDFIVVWEEYPYLRGDPSGTGILARRYDASGTAAGPPFLVNSYTPYGQSNPKVAMDTAGDFAVVWYYNDYGGGGSIIAGRSFDGTGAPLGPDFQVNTNTACCPAYNGVDEDPDGIEVAFNPSGRFMVAWEESQADDRRDVVARLFDPGGTPATPPFLVNTFTTDDQHYPGIAADPSGNFIVTWRSNAFPAADGIFARRFDGNGVPIGGELQVSTSEVGIYGAHVATDPAGHFVVVWDDTYSVIGREFDASGAPVGGEFRIDDPPPPLLGSQARTPTIGAAGGDFVVTWSSYYDGNWDVHARVLRQVSECSPVPLTTCREPTVERRGILWLMAGATPAHDRLVWRWVRGEATPLADFGSPFDTTRYAFCLYDASGAPQPRLVARAPAGDTCGPTPCWLPIGATRIDYNNHPRAPDGLSYVRLGSGTEGKATIVVKANGEKLALPALPLAAPVVAQLQAEGGPCWSATYDAFVVQNDATKFRANPDAGS